jgi:hypothetical protein
MGKHYTCDKFIRIDSIKFNIIDDGLWTSLHEDIVKAVRDCDIANNFPVAAEYKQEAINTIDDAINKKLEELAQLRSSQRPPASNDFKLSFHNGVGVLFGKDVFTYSNSNHTDILNKLLQKIVNSMHQKHIVATPINIEICYHVAYRKPKHTIKRCTYARNGKHKVYATTYEQSFMDYCWGSRNDTVSTIVNADYDKLREYFSKAA